MVFASSPNEAQEILSYALGVLDAVGILPMLEAAIYIVIVAMTTKVLFQWLAR